MKDSARIAFSALIAAVLACPPARAQDSGSVVAESPADPSRGLAPEVVALSSLTRLEIVDRVFEIILNGSMNQAAVQRMFGIAAEHSRPDRAIRILGYRDRPDNMAGRFVYRLTTCDSAQFFVPALRCTEANVQQLQIALVFEDTQAEETDRNRCLRTRDVSARLVASGWTFTIAPEILDRVPVREPWHLPLETLTKAGTYVVLWPHDPWGGMCLVDLTIYAPVADD